MPSCSNCCTACDLPEDILRRRANKYNFLRVCYAEGSWYLENPDISGKSAYGDIRGCGHARRPFIQARGENESSNATRTEIEEVGVDASCSIEVGGVYIVRSSGQDTRRRRCIVGCEDLTRDLGRSGYLDDNEFRRLLIYLNKRMIDSPDTLVGNKTKEKPVMKVEPAGLSPTFPVIEDWGTLEMPVLASITKFAAESRLTGAGDVALADICKRVNNLKKKLVKHLHQLFQSPEGYRTLMKKYLQWPGEYGVRDTVIGKITI